ncbi:MAG: hypothetical protein ACTS3F_08275 [Phycisphaerales bacterium]
MIDTARAVEVLRMADELTGWDPEGRGLWKWSADDPGDRDRFAGILGRLSAAMPVHRIPHDADAWDSINTALAECPTGVPATDHAIETARCIVMTARERAITTERAEFEKRSDYWAALRASMWAADYAEHGEAPNLQRIGDALARFVRRSLWEQCAKPPDTQQRIAEAYEPMRPMPSEPAARAELIRQRCRTLWPLQESKGSDTDARLVLFVTPRLWELDAMGAFNDAPSTTRGAIRVMLTDPELGHARNKDRWSLCPFHDAPDDVKTRSLFHWGMIGEAMVTDGLFAHRTTEGIRASLAAETGAIDLARRALRPIAEAVARLGYREAERIERGECGISSDRRATGANAHPTEQTDPGLRDADWFRIHTNGGLPASTLSKAAREGRLADSVRVGKRWRHNAMEVARVYSDFGPPIRDAMRTNANEHERN